MLNKLDEIQSAALQALESVTDDDTLQTWRVTHTGRSSALMQVFSGLGGLTKEERPLVGQKANKVKLALEAAFGERSQIVQEAALKRSLENEHLDISLPGRPLRGGRLHPATQTLRRMLGILAEMGFQVYHLQRSGNG